MICNMHMYETVNDVYRYDMHMYETVTQDFHRRFFIEKKGEY